MTTQEVTVPDEETYEGNCPWWGQPLASIDRWNDDSLHCTKCGRPITTVDGERRHAVEFEAK